MNNIVYDHSSSATNLNVERLSELADWLEAGAPHKHITFKMNHFIDPKLIDSTKPCTKDNICGTACCIAGAATMFYHPEVFHVYTDVVMDVNYHDLAREALGLNDDQARQLFYANLSDLDYITPEWAAKVIRNLIKTGKVDWKKFQPEAFRRARI